jgi:6-phosphogluconate dehydrogenase
MERDAKIENMVCWHKNLLAEAKALKEEIDNLTARKKVAENKADRLKEMVNQALDGVPFKTAKCAVSFRTSTALEVTDEAALQQWADYTGSEVFRYKKPEPSKASIKALLDDGVEVPGVEMVTRRNVVVK